MNTKFNSATSASEAKELYDQIRRWQAEERKLALATVIETWGSSPRPEGSHLLVEENGQFSGSVSGGCVEAAVIQEAMAVIKNGEVKILDFGISNEQAWDVGLSCGGKLKVMVNCLQPQSAQWRALMPPDDGNTTAIATRLSDGAQCLVSRDSIAGDLKLTPSQLEASRALLKRAQSGLLHDKEIFLRVYCPPFRLLIVGAVHITQFLLPMAEQAGFAVSVIDPRRGFASEVRFPDVELINSWPDQALRDLKPDSNTAIVVLCHDPKLDDPALQVALTGAAFYVGALGSRRTHAKRLQRLQDLNLGHLSEKIHAPIGLDLGGRAPAEIAVAILAEIIKVRYQRESSLKPV